MCQTALEITGHIQSHTSMLLSGAIANDSGLTRLTTAGIPWVIQPGVIATAGDVRVEAGEVF